MSIVFDMSDAIEPFLSTFIVQRIPVVYDVNNRPFEGVPVTFTSVGGIQESTAKDLQLLPEGEYQEEVFTFFTKDNLKSGLDDGVIKPDQIYFDGQWYKIVLKANWRLYNYYRYLIRKIDSDVV